MGMEVRSGLRWDNLWLGVRVGIFVPILALFVMIVVVFFWQAEGAHLLDYLLGEGIPSRMLSLATLCNLIPFLIAVYTDRYFTSRGILGVTILLAILTAALRLLL